MGGGVKTTSAERERGNETSSVLIRGPRERPREDREETRCILIGPAPRRGEGGGG